jgi:hypothetical protein
MKLQFDLLSFVICAEFCSVVTSGKIFRRICANSELILLLLLANV